MDFRDMPLKDMDAAMLVLAIQQATGNDSRINEALALAAYCHKEKTRSNPTRNSKGKVTQATAPYIEHPLRVALRVIRWGETSPNVVISALLHDVVEDHARELCELLALGTGVPIPETEEDRYFDALSYIQFKFGWIVRGIVQSLTNDPKKIEDRDERNKTYAKKVAYEIEDLDVFLIKLSDFCDNALGLHHQKDNPKMVKRLAEKYLPLVDIFWHQFFIFKSNGVDFHPDIIRRLNEAKPYLEELLNG